MAATNQEVVYTEAGESSPSAPAQAAASAPASAFGGIPQIAAVREVLSNLKFSVWSKHVRSWSEFVKKENFGRPLSVEEAKSRVERNLKYFYGNYLMVFMVVLALTFLAQPLVMLGMFAVVMLYRWVESREQILMIAGRNKSIANNLVCGILLVLLAGGSVITVVGVVAILSVIHAVAFEYIYLAAVDDNADNDTMVGEVDLDEIAAAGETTV